MNRRRKYHIETAIVSDETLGSCGCTDYHMADCPLMRPNKSTREDFDDAELYERYYDDS